MAQNLSTRWGTFSAVPAVTLPKQGGGTALFTDTSDANAVASDIATGKTAYVNGEKITGTNSGGGGGEINIGTKTVTATSYPVQISFTGLEAEPKAFVVKSTTQMSSSGSTTYYYIVDIVYDGTSLFGNCFRIGSTRRVNNITSGYSYTYSNGTLTVKSSASSRSASPGAFNNGYELVYIY